MHSTQRPTQSKDTQESRFGAQIKYYGGSAAVCFQSSVLKEQMATLNIEIAPIVNHQPRWNEKLNFQLSENELPLFCGLLFGYLPTLDIRRDTKGIELARQKRDTKNHPGLYIFATSGSAHQHRLLLPTGIMAKVGSLAASRFTLDLGVDMSIALPAIRAACSLYY